MANGHSARGTSKASQGSVPIPPARRSASGSRWASPSPSASNGKRRLDEIDQRPEVAVLAVAPVAERDLVGGTRPSGSAADGKQRRIDRRRADRRPFVEAAVRQVAVRAAAERRRVRRQRQLALERRAGVAVGAADRQLRLERPRRVDRRQDRSLELGGRVGGRGELQDLAVGDRADDALGEDRAPARDRAPASPRGRSKRLGEHGAHRRRGVHRRDRGERAR